jgi:hypothetical protein
MKQAKNRRRIEKKCERLKISLEINELVAKRGRSRHVASQ